MKVVQRVFFTLILFMLCVCNVIAKEPPPPLPNGRTAKVMAPPPPVLSVDENIYTMMLLALFFGIYIIYSFKLKQKTPM